MIGSYMDESFDRAQAGVFAVGGLLGRGVPFFELERKWEKLRKRPDIDIAYFKASQCQRGKGEFSKFVADPKNITQQERAKLDSISQEFLNLIAKEELIVAGVGVIQDDFYDVIKDSNAHTILGDSPYRLAYDFAMIQCAWAMKKLNTGDTVSFVCDEHETYSSLANNAYCDLKAKNPHASKYMAAFSSADDRYCEPLQAADAAVFEIRRALKLALGQRKGQLRQQFNILADAGKMFLIQHTDRKHLLHIIANHKPGEPFKLDEIMEQTFSENIKIRI